MYYDKDGNYVGDQPSDIPDTSKEEKKKKKKNKNKNDGSDKQSTASKIAKAGADAAGQMAAAHRQSWSGYSGGSTDVVDSSKNMTAARGPSDVLSKAERKRLEQLTGGYG